MRRGCRSSWSCRLGLHVFHGESFLLLNAYLIEWFHASKTPCLEHGFVLIPRRTYKPKKMHINLE